MGDNMDLVLARLLLGLVNPFFQILFCAFPKIHAPVIGNFKDGAAELVPGRFQCLLQGLPAHGICGIMQHQFIRVPFWRTFRQHRKGNPTRPGAGTQDSGHQKHRRLVPGLAKTMGVGPGKMPQIRCRGRTKSIHGLVRILPRRNLPHAVSCGTPAAPETLPTPRVRLQPRIKTSHPQQTVVPSAPKTRSLPTVYQTPQAFL